MGSGVPHAPAVVGMEETLHWHSRVVLTKRLDADQQA